MQIIGIDISKKRLHAAWLRDPEQERSRPKAADNTRAGHRQLLAWSERHSKCPPEQLCFVLAATGVYHEAAAFLGLIPVEYDSGTSVHRRPRLPKAGDGRWRARL